MGPLGVEFCAETQTASKRGGSQVTRWRARRYLIATRLRIPGRVNRVLGVQNWIRTVDTPNVRLRLLLQQQSRSSVAQWEHPRREVRKTSSCLCGTEFLQMAAALPRSFLHSHCRVITNSPRTGTLLLRHSAPDSAPFTVYPAPCHNGAVICGETHEEAHTHIENAILMILAEMELNGVSPSADEPVPDRVVLTFATEREAE